MAQYALTRIVRIPSNPQGGTHQLDATDIAMDPDRVQRHVYDLIHRQHAPGADICVMTYQGLSLTDPYLDIVYRRVGGIAQESRSLKYLFTAPLERIPSRVKDHFGSQDPGRLEARAVDYATVPTDMEGILKGLQSAPFVLIARGGNPRFLWTERRTSPIDAPHLCTHYGPAALAAPFNRKEFDARMIQFQQVWDTYAVPLKP